MAQSIPMNRRTLLVFAMWAATAAGAIGATTAVISVLGAGITDNTVKPMSASEVQQALQRSAPPVAVASPTPQRSTPAPKVKQVVTRSIGSSGGNATVRCARSGAYLVSWSPNQGYSTDAYRRGPNSRIFVEFESGSTQVTMNLGCKAGAPVSLGIDHRHITHSSGGNGGGSDGNKLHFPFKLPIKIPIKIPGL